jgi:K+-sensing histidine kinase KdpD
MTDNLIIKYKNEYSQQEILKEKHSLIDLIKQRCNALLSFFDRKHQYIELIVEDKIPMLYFDFEAIEKVINNLLINASEQSLEDSKIIIHIKKLEDYVWVSFINNGHFETSESLNTIFDEYITCTNKFRKIGFGLELFNCKKIIEAHQGRIWANNETDKGTSITFCLPII